MVKKHHLSRLQTLLVLLILNGEAKTKLTILPILCCEEIVKNSIEYRIIGINSWRESNSFHLSTKCSSKIKWKYFQVTLLKHFLLKVCSHGATIYAEIAEIAIHCYLRRCSHGATATTTSSQNWFSKSVHYMIHRSRWKHSQWALLFLEVL